MHPYELMVILDPRTDERTVQSSIEKFLSVITADGGEITEVDYWGKRRLAYEVKKHTEGIYVVATFTATPAATAELDRQLNLAEFVLRTKVLRADELLAQKAEQNRREQAKKARAAKVSA